MFKIGQGLEWQHWFPYSHRCLYIGKYPPPGGGIFADISWGKNMKMGKRKGENVKEKGRMWKEKVKMGSKRVK
jgi:hypothetical protein